MKKESFEYVGFWARVGASIIDAILLMLITYPLLAFLYSGTANVSQNSLYLITADIFISWILPAVGVIVFWCAKQATPGKMAVSCKIVDASSGEPAGRGQLFGRYFAYTISGIPFGLGFLWVACDERKQGWHDKLSGTMVIRQAASKDMACDEVDR
ncbi:MULTISPECIES: RDD family protein [unclassified Halomonas]|uniref:RDD family protein n=1 Tax=unclassified Halomonas TaxID=2609666 RepID=UPI0007D956F1|nr:RDD family protein [Halomonas sp. ALS9]MBT2785303.1 RDD family protein [Halomonas sp. ISL-106]MBT2799324.1 RDD family protein [Halomonas sp. ISL-104]OAL59582.1 hypothetical protein A6R74_02805 [Halomonas sp. ALS9]